MAELADARDLKFRGRKAVCVRSPPPAPYSVSNLRGWAVRTAVRTCAKNALTLLSHPLRVQLHDLSDEQCMQQAGDMLQLVLTALLENIADVLKDQDVLKEAASRLKQVGS